MILVSPVGKSKHSGLVRTNTIGATRYWFYAIDLGAKDLEAEEGALGRFLREVAEQPSVEAA